MAQTKTFKQIIEGGYTYPTIIPPDLQAVIYDWYQDRHVADDDKFSIWFSRILRNDYEQYKQILRIEPGYAQYDWLVTQYRELQREEEGSAETGTTSTSTGSRRLESDGSITKTDDKTTDRTMHDSETVSDDTTIGKTGSIQYSNTSTKTGNDRTEHDATTDVTTSGTSSEQSQTNRDTDERNMQKNLPMSTTYAPGTVGPVTPNLDWTTASAQMQTTADDDTNSQSSKTSGGTEHNVLDGEDKTTYNTTNSDTATTGTTDTETVNNDKSISKDTTDRVVVDGDQTETRSTLDITTDSGSNASTALEETSGRIREIYTGRQGQIANIMEQAKQFIASTNAWDWFMTRIDTVFMGVYEI